MTRAQNEHMSSESALPFENENRRKPDHLEAPCICLYFLISIYLIFSDPVSRVYLKPRNPGDALSTYINANYIRVKKQMCIMRMNVPTYISFSC